ncbi:hypothetical protein Ciccas_003807 [Cichlidogyrus casuarinus]|uniref:Uncharacterized protein n=1 Tax=Cichlidogyrus casuarinus TaxID=1844966 RepID=A0ABD2QE63_9PLAT
MPVADATISSQRKQQRSMVMRPLNPKMSPFYELLSLKQWLEAICFYLNQLYTHDRPQCVQRILNLHSNLPKELVNKLVYDAIKVIFATTNTSIDSILSRFLPFIIHPDQRSHDNEETLFVAYCKLLHRWPMTQEKVASIRADDDMLRPLVERSMSHFKQRNQVSCICDTSKKCSSFRLSEKHFACIQPFMAAAAKVAWISLIGFVDLDLKALWRVNLDQRSQCSYVGRSLTYQSYRASFNSHVDVDALVTHLNWPAVFLDRFLWSPSTQFDLVPDRNRFSPRLLMKGEAMLKVPSMDLNLKALALLHEDWSNQRSSKAAWR